MLKCANLDYNDSRYNSIVSFLRYVFSTWQYNLHVYVLFIDIASDYKTLFVNVKLQIIHICILPFLSSCRNIYQGVFTQVSLPVSN